MIDASDPFWCNVQIGAPDLCWPWRGTLSTSGYGQISRGKYPSQLAHRVAYWLTCGRLEPGAVIRHTCDHRPCCNPLHLLSGTHQDNSDDMVRRGRSCLGRKRPGTGPAGERNGRALLTQADVIAIRQAAANGLNCRAIAAIWPIGKSQAHNIITGKQWKGGSAWPRR